MTLDSGVRGTRISEDIHRSSQQKDDHPAGNHAKKVRPKRPTGVNQGRGSGVFCAGLIRSGWLWAFSAEAVRWPSHATTRGTP